MIGSLTLRLVLNLNTIAFGALVSDFVAAFAWDSGDNAGLSEGTAFDQSEQIQDVGQVEYIDQDAANQAK